MKASFVDLRKKSSEILRALDRNESITLLYRGKPKAIVHPLSSEQSSPAKTRDYAAFGLWKDRSDMSNVATHVRRIRKGRFDGL